MQKRIVYCFNNGSNVQKSGIFSKSGLKRALSGKFTMLAMACMLFVFSLFCAIGSADWIISQQKALNNDEMTSIFTRADAVGTLVNESLSNQKVTFDGTQKSEVTLLTFASTVARDFPEKYSIQFRFVNKNVVSSASSVTAQAYAANALSPSDVIWQGSSAATSATAAGEYYVRITVGDAQTPYVAEFGYAIIGFTIEPKQVSLIWANPQSLIYNGAAKLPTATYMDVNGNSCSATVTISGSNDTLSGGTAQAINAGTYTATATIADKNYAVSSGSTHSFTIEKAHISSVNWANHSGLVYNGSAQFPTATYTGADGKYYTATVTISGDNATVSGDTAQAIKAGSYTATATVATNDINHVFAANGSFTQAFTIAQKEVSLTWANFTETYNGAAKLPAATYTDVTSVQHSAAVTISGTNATVSGGTAQAINAGTYTATAAISDANYVIKTDTKTKTLTINKASVSNVNWAGGTEFSADGTTHSPTATYTGADGTTYAATITISGTNATVSGDTAQAIKAGNYTATATVATNDINHVFSASGNFTQAFTIKQASKIPVTVTWSNTSVYYNAKAQTPTATAKDENGNTVSVTVTINGTGTAMEVGSYTAKATLADELKDTSEIFQGSTCTFKIIALPIKLKPLIERDYSNGGIDFKAGFFKDCFETTLDNSNGYYNEALSNAHTYVNAAKAYNYITYKSSDTSATNPDYMGNFCYSLNEIIKAGSTYKIEITQYTGNNYKYEAEDCYLKYKTAKVGDDYYTLEDAIVQQSDNSNDIVTAGNSTSASSYVVTAFSKLQLNATNGDSFSAYKYPYNYTLSGRSLIAQYADGGTKIFTFTDTASYGNVFSAIIINEGVKLTLDNANLVAAAKVGFHQDISSSLCAEHGVIMNNGTVIVNSGTVDASGYIKGTGTIELDSGTTAYDAISIYDWPGGTAANSMYKKVFPSNAYTYHNISCNVKVYAGATYKVRAFVYMQRLNLELNTDFSIVNDGTNAALFKAKNTNKNTDQDKDKCDHVIKSVKVLDKVNNINLNIASTNQRSTQNGKVTNTDVIEIYGDYEDSTISIEASFIFVSLALKTSTSIPLPLGFTDITLARGSLSFSSSDYLILPGASFTVNKGTSLTLGTDVDMVALTYQSVKEKMPNPSHCNYLKHYISGTNGNEEDDGKLIINGTLSGSGNVGGNVRTETAEASLTITGRTGTYVYYTSVDDPYYVSGTLPATGKLSDGGEFTQFSTGVNYKSLKGTNGYYWAIADNVKQLSFNANGKNVKTKTVVTDGDNYYLAESDFPGVNEITKPHYTFNGWYTGKNGTGTKMEAGSAITADTTLYAHFTPNEYKVEYSYNANTVDGLDTNKITNGNPTNYTYDTVITLKEPTYQNDENSELQYTFMGWFADAEFTKEIKQITAGTWADSLWNEFDGNGSITLYGKWTKEATKNVTITFKSGCDGVKLLDTDDIELTERNPKVLIDSGSDYTIPTVKAEYDGNKAVLDDKYLNDNYNFSKIFFGWQVTYENGSTTTLTGATPVIENLKESITLTALWKDKATLTVKFKDTLTKDLTAKYNESEYQSFTKYLMPGEQYNSDAINLICSAFNVEHYDYQYYVTGENVNDTNKNPTIDLAENTETTITLVYLRWYKIVINDASAGVTNQEHWVSTTTDSYDITKYVVQEYMPNDDTKYVVSQITVSGNTGNVFVDNSATKKTVNLSLDGKRADSTKEIILTVQRETWYKVINNYSDKVTVTGAYYINGFAKEGSSINIKLSSGIIGTKAKITNNGNSQSISAGWSSTETNITVAGVVTIDEG